jgi:hypothetical protein
VVLLPPPATLPLLRSEDIEHRSSPRPPVTGINWGRGATIMGV